jgi:hypothetical protein
MRLNCNAGQPGTEYRNAVYWESIHEKRAGEFSAVGYPELGEGFNRVTYSLRLQAVERLLRRCGAPQPVILLEGGVGIGAYAPLWRELGVSRWIGLDISATAVEQMARKYPAGEFRTADLCNREELDVVLGSSRFDLVTAIDILYHIVDDGNFCEALDNLASRVSLDGLFLLSDIFSRQDCTPAKHVKRRSLDSYYKILEPCGFRLLGRGQVFGVIGYGEIPSAGVADTLLSTAWRGAAKLVRTCPAAARGLVGTAAGHGLKPLDAAVRAAGLGRGSNLELALFRRVS